MATGPIVISQKRNVVVVGKSGAGKSTICNQIIGTNRFVVASGLDSTTKVIQHEEVKFTQTDEDGETEYTFKVVDTVGLFDPDSARRKKAANKEVLNQAKRYARDTIPEGVSVILFVFREGRFTREEDATFRALFKHFGDDIAAMSALVITGCENRSEQDKRTLVADFLTNPRTADFARFMEKGIHPVGFPDIAKIRPPLADAYKEGMEADRKTLLRLIMNSKDMRLSDKLFQDAFWRKFHKMPCI